MLYFCKKRATHLAKFKDEIWQKHNNQGKNDVIYPVLESTEPTKSFSLKMKEEVINLDKSITGRFALISVFQKAFYTWDISY